MKPKTILQKKVAELSLGLPLLTNKQQKYAYAKCFERYFYSTLKHITCFECNHKWDRTKGDNVSKSIKCPSCGLTLKARPDKIRVFDYAEYFAIHTTHCEHQVLRYFLVRKFYNVNKSALYSITEVVQRFINTKGQITTMAVSCNSFSYCIDMWNGTQLEVRYPHSRHDVSAIVTYPTKAYLPIVYRNGFKGEFPITSEALFLSRMMYDRIAEALLKSNQIAMLRHYLRRYDLSPSDKSPVPTWWPSLKICIRNNYIIEDSVLWIDQVNMLVAFGKDILNSKYVCSPTLKKDHDRLIEKQRRINQAKAVDKLRAKIDKLDIEFKAQKSGYFGIKLSDSEIDVVVLNSVQEYYEEGATLKHCVFSGKYYEEKDSLILSARIGEQRIETIEFSLKSKRVVQCRGLLNENTEHHDRIVNLVNKNANQIRAAKL